MIQRVLLVLTFVLSIEENRALRFNHEYARLVDGKSVCDKKLKVTYLDFHKINRTTKALSVNFTLYEDITKENEVEIRSQFYAWKSNEFKKTPFSWTMYSCRFLDSGKLGIQMLLSDSSIRQCPLRKGKHYVRNVAPPDGVGWPSIFPEGRWKLEIQYWWQDVYCLTVEWIAQVLKN